MLEYFSFTNKLFKSSAELNQGVFKGIRVLDLSHVIYGPMVSKFLALQGAEVIKVEQPEDGDVWRTATYWNRYWKYSSPYFQYFNINKYFIAIDIRKPKGRELIFKLAEKSDVFIENFRAGLLDAWGIGYTQISEVNPKIIYISCSGYGQWGPLRFFPSWDLIAQSMAGIGLATGFPGRATYKLQDYYGDFLPALFGAIAVLAALYYREKTGEGQYIDMAQAEALMRIMHEWTYMSVTGKEIGCTGNVDPTMSPSGIFKTCDGKFIALAIATDEQFLALVKAMGKTELAKDKRFKETLERLKPENIEELNRIVEEWVKSKTEKEIIELAKKHGFPASRVMDDWQIVNDEWRRERGSVVEVKDEIYGKGIFPLSPVIFHKTPGKIKWLTRPIGYHNRYILKKLLGLSKKEIEKLEKEGVIGYWDNKVGLRPPPYYDIEKDPIFNYNGEEGAGN